MELPRFYVCITCCAAHTWAPAKYIYLWWFCLLAGFFNSSSISIVFDWVTVTSSADILDLLLVLYDYAHFVQDCASAWSEMERIFKMERYLPWFLYLPNDLKSHKDKLCKEDLSSWWIRKLSFVISQWIKGYLFQAEVKSHWLTN